MKVPKQPLTRERLAQFVRYEPETGKFYVVGKMRGKRIGQIAGNRRPEGYRRIHIDGKCYGANVLAWLWMTGEMPTGFVDHRDRNPRNDRWENLRQADRSQNMANRKWKQKSGRKGVYKASKSRWSALIHWRGQRFYLGLFSCPDEASAAYAAKAKELHGDFAVF